MVFMQNVTWNATYYIGREVPLSSNMTFFRLQWGVFVNMLIMIWAGELFFKDKTVNIWQITDALPVPVWVTQLSRFGAVIGLSFVLSLSFIIISIVTQVVLGGAAYIDLGRFAEDLLLHRWAFLTFVLFSAIVFFVAGLTANRIVTHIVSVGYFLFLIISFDMGIMEDLRFGYALHPCVADFSEMNGYGIFQQSANWFFIMWVALAIALIMAGIWLWKRGADKKWSNRLSIKNVQLNLVSKFALLVCLVAFFGLMSFISKSVYETGNFTPEAKEERLDAEYEKKYKHLDSRPQPKYSVLDLQIDLFPSERKATFLANITLTNETAVDTLFLNWKDFINVIDLKLIGQALQPVKIDEELNLTAYLIPKGAHSDSLMNFSLEAEKRYTGFVQSDAQADLTYVGSFACVQDFLPVIGYDAEKELLENRKRAEQGLKKLDSRMAAIDDPIAVNQDAFAPDANPITGSITISTDADQTPFTAGKLISREIKNGRHIARYKIDRPQVFNWYLGSSDYELANSEANGVKYTIFHKPSHTFNLDLYHDAINKGTAFIRKQFGARAVAKDLKLVEIHRWQDANFVFANTIVLSEKEGWVADTDGVQEQAYIYQTIGSGLASLRVQNNLRIANVQGADMLIKALPEALGLQFVQEVFGDEAVELLIKKKMDKYGKDRKNEPNTEPVLLYADVADYLEVNKGAVELYRLIDRIGLAKLKTGLQQAAGNEPKRLVFASFYQSLKVGVSKAIQDDMEKAFESKQSFESSL